MPATETVIAVGVAGTAVVAGTGLVVNDQLEKYVRRRFNEKPYTGFPMPCLLYTSPSPRDRG